MHLHRKKPIHKHTWVYVVFFILLFLLVLRMILPSLMVSYANSRLKKESPYFSFHINDIDLSIFKGRYTLEGITGKMKPSGEPFVSISSINLVAPWKNIFKGKIVTDVFVNRVNMTASQTVLDHARAEGERIKNLSEDKKEEKESPLMVRTFRLSDSNLTIQDLLSFRGEDKRSISHINVLASNLTPTDKNPITNFVMTADVFGPAPLKVGGMATLKTEPPQWDVNTELKQFDLTTVNPLVKEKIKASFQKGKMDLYGEAKSEMGKIEGYIKPFVTKLQMDLPKGGFKFKGVASKTRENLTKILLTNTASKTLATYFPFTYDDTLNYEFVPPLQMAIEHKVKQDTIKPGIENKIDLESSELLPVMREAQEEKKR